MLGRAFYQTLFAKPRKLSLREQLQNLMNEASVVYNTETKLLSLVYTSKEKAFKLQQLLIQFILNNLSSPLEPKMFTIFGAPSPYFSFNFTKPEYNFIFADNNAFENRICDFKKYASITRSF